MNIIDHEFLMPAHTFARKSDGATSRILFITNTALSPKVQKAHPPQVVYVDENDNILSRDILGFLETREFVNVDPELEAKLNALLVQNVEFPEDELDLDVDLEDDVLVITGSDELDDVLAGMSGAELSGETESEESDDEVQVIGASVADMSDVEADMAEGDDLSSVSYVAVNEGLPANLTAEQLSAATVSYQQEPSPTGGIRHVLFIRAGEGVTRAMLDASFNTAHLEQCTIYAPQIDFEGETLMPASYEFVGVYAASFYGSNMYQVILDEDTNLSDDESAEVAALMSEELPQVSNVVDAVPTEPEPIPVIQPQPTQPVAPALQVVANAAPAAVQVVAQ